MTANSQLNEPLQPILVMMSYRGGERLQRCLDSIATAEHHFKRIVLSITAAEDSEDIARARQKLERKGVDLIVLNDISDATIGFDADDNAVVIVSATDETRVARASKRAVAAAVLDRVEEFAR